MNNNSQVKTLELSGYPANHLRPNIVKHIGLDGRCVHLSELICEDGAIKTLATRPTKTGKINKRVIDLKLQDVLIYIKEGLCKGMKPQDAQFVDHGDDDSTEGF